MADLKQSNLIISSIVPAHAAMPDNPDSLDDTDGASDFAEFETRQATVPISSHGERLDRTLALVVPEFSRSYLQQLIASSAVLHNGLAQTKSSARVKAGDALTRLEDLVCARPLCKTALDAISCWR